MMKKISLLFILLFISILLPAQSTVEIGNIYSSSLGLNKPYSIYLPDGYNVSTESYPVVYFFRLSHAEWFTSALRSDGNNLALIVDELIENEQIGKMIIVCADLGGSYPVVGDTDWGIVNMLRPDLADDDGIGTGAFEDFFFQDMIPHIDSTYRTIPQRCARGADGFSLGGYTSLLYGLKHPEVFSSVGSFDGTLMFYDFDDPGLPSTMDDWWITNTDYAQQISAMFGDPYDLDYMKLNNPTHILVNADSATLERIREVTFHVSTGLNNACCNHTRNIQFVGFLEARGIHNSIDNAILAPDASHDWVWADIHAAQTLVKHWEIFDSLSCTTLTTGTNTPISFSHRAELFQNYPNPARSLTTIEFKLPAKSTISLYIIDCFGKKIKSLAEGIFPQGMHQIQIDVSGYPEGVYSYQLKSDAQVYTRRLIVVN